VQITAGRLTNLDIIGAVITQACHPSDQIRPAGAPGPSANVRSSRLGHSLSDVLIFIAGMFPTPFPTARP